MLSAKTEYACLALMQLAEAYAEGKPVQASRLASVGRIPEGFLVQILQELKRAGLVQSTRGACGGYRLAQPPEQVSLGDAIDLIDGAPSQGSNLSQPTAQAEALLSVCEEAAHAERESLRGVTLSELANRATAPAEMWYI